MASALIRQWVMGGENWSATVAVRHTLKSQFHGWEPTRKNEKPKKIRSVDGS